MQGYEDTLHQVVGKAQQLFAYPVSEYAGKRIQDSDSHSDTYVNFPVSDETVPDKTKVCNFCFKVDANKTAIVGNLCDKFENILVQLVHTSGARPLVDNALC